MNILDGLDPRKLLQHLIIEFIKVLVSISAKGIDVKNDRNKIKNGKKRRFIQKNKKRKKTGKKRPRK